MNLLTNSSRRYAIASVLAAIGLMNLTSCASVTEQNKKLAEIEVPSYWTNGKSVQIKWWEVGSFDDRSEKRFKKSPFHLTSGQHPIKVVTEWSNGWQDANVLYVDVIEGHHYYVFAYEFASPQNPPIAEIHVRTPVESFGREMRNATIEGSVKGLAPAIIMTAPIWAPIMLLQGDEEPPERRPFDNCCFIWIEDGDTTDVVAGNRPIGAIRN